MPAPWERQPDESAEAFEAWVLYRDGQPDATIRSVAEQLDKSRQLVGRWSSDWDWQRRLRAWQAEEDRARREGRLKAIEERSERQARIAQAGLEALAAVPAEVLRRLKEDPQWLRGLERWDLLRMLGVSTRAMPQLVRAERLALGLSTEALSIDDAREAGRRRGEHMGDAELDAELTGIPDGLEDDAYRQGRADERALLEAEAAAESEPIGEDLAG